MARASVSALPSDTGDDLEDVFVWVKPGGESDGTSGPTAARYDSFWGRGGIGVPD